MLTIIVPQPVRDALLEMIRPLANECDPPSRCNVDGFAPSPTTNGSPLEITVPAVLSVPPTKTNCTLEFVTIRLSTVTMRPFHFILPVSYIKIESLLYLLDRCAT